MRNKLIIATVLSFIFIIMIVMVVKAETDLDGYSEPKIQRVTCYHYNSGITYSGTVPTEGRTCGGKKENIGKAAVLYRINPDGSIGELVDILVIEDTGSAKRIQEGSIDIYKPNLEKCKDWVREYGDYMYVQIVDAKG